MHSCTAAAHLGSQTGLCREGCRSAVARVLLARLRSRREQIYCRPKLHPLPLQWTHVHDSFSLKRLRASSAQQNRRRRAGWAHLALSHQMQGCAVAHQTAAYCNQHATLVLPPTHFTTPARHPTCTPRNARRRGRGSRRIACRRCSTPALVRREGRVRPFFWASHVYRGDIVSKRQCRVTAAGRSGQRARLMQRHGVSRRCGWALLLSLAPRAPPCIGSLHGKKEEDASVAVNCT